MRKLVFPRWLPPMRTRAHLGCLLALSIFNIVRNTKTLHEIDTTRQVHVPIRAVSHEGRRRVVNLEVSRRALQNNQNKAVKRRMEMGFRPSTVDDDIPPPRESWSYTLPGQEEEEDEEDECIPMNDWQTLLFPDCNRLHELGIPDDIVSGNGNETNVIEVGRVLSGSTRNSWKIPIAANSDHSHVSLKTRRMGQRFDEHNFERQRMEALAMERLTSSPNVIDIFGYCGQSSITENDDGDTLKELLTSWDVTPREKLVLSLDMAQTVSNLHGAASMVHGNLDVAKFLVLRGKLKLSDFSHATFLRQNKRTHATCEFQANENEMLGGSRIYNSQSPEEVNGSLLSKKIDSYGIGAMLFYMLTNSNMYHCEGGDYCFIRNSLSNEEIQRLKVNGVSPALPAFVAETADQETNAIKKVMRESLATNVTARPSALNIVDSIRDSLFSLDNRHARLECPAYDHAESNRTTGTQIFSDSQPRVFLAGLVLDATSISSQVFNKLVELNCNHGFGIHIVAESGRNDAIARYNDLQPEYVSKSGKSCAPFIIIGEPENLSKTTERSERVDRIALLRDFQRERLHLAFNRDPSDRDVVILVDLDLFSIPSVETITQEACNMIHRRDHDVVCAAGLMHKPFGYYDTFATILRPDTFVYPMRGRLVPSRRGENLALVRSDDLYGTVTQEHILAYFENKRHQTSNGAVPVRSCFGGMALYRTSKWFIPQCRYSMSTEKLKEYANKSDGRPCEHVVFHLCLSAKDPSTELVVQPKLQTLWDEPVEATNRLESNHGFRSGLVTVSKRATEGSRLVNGPYHLRINEVGHLVVEKEMDNGDTSILWTANTTSNFFHKKWSTMFLTLGRDGKLRLTQQVQQVRKELPPGKCKLVDATGTSCRVEVWSSNITGPTGQYFLELTDRGTLLVMDKTRKVLWTNGEGILRTKEVAERVHH